MRREREGRGDRLCAFAFVPRRCIFVSRRAKGGHRLVACTSPEIDDKASVKERYVEKYRGQNAEGGERERTEKKLTFVPLPSQPDSSRYGSQTDL